MQGQLQEYMSVQDENCIVSYATIVEIQDEPIVIDIKDTGDAAFNSIVNETNQDMVA